MPGTATPPLVVLSVKFVVVPLIVVASMASLNVAVTVEDTATFVALFAGVLDDTTGGVVSAIVVNAHTLLAAIALPARSFTPVVMVAV